MSQYFVQAAHTPEECLDGLDEILAQGPDVLARYSFGCAVGDHSNHTAFYTIEAASQAAARAALPERQRAGATVLEVGKFTPEQVRAAHGGL